MGQGEKEECGKENRRNGKRKKRGMGKGEKEEWGKEKREKEEWGKEKRRNGARRKGGMGQGEKGVWYGSEELGKCKDVSRLMNWLIG